MVAITFDTLEFSKTLQNSGFSQEQADAMAQAQRKAMQEMLVAQQLATKGDLQEVRNELKGDLKDLEYRITVRLGAMMAASIAIIATLVKLL
ncbi:MAG: coiled-coil domain-containing protein [Pseudomonadota bacterium]